MIHVIAIITTKPGKREDVLAEFHKIVPMVHAEKGCIEYQPTVDSQSAGDMPTKVGADTFVVIEKWETIADLHAHSAADHMKAYGQKVGSLIADRCIHILE